MKRTVGKVSANLGATTRKSTSTHPSNKLQNVFFCDSLLPSSPSTALMHVVSPPTKRTHASAESSFFVSMQSSWLVVLKVKWVIVEQLEELVFSCLLSSLLRPSWEREVLPCVCMQAGVGVCVCVEVGIKAPVCVYVRMANICAHKRPPKWAHYIVGLSISCVLFVHNLSARILSVVPTYTPPFCLFARPFLEWNISANHFLTTPVFVATKLWCLYSTLLYSPRWLKLLWALFFRT